MPARILSCFLLLLLPLPVSSQDSLAVVRSWQPLAVGDRWIYVREFRGGDRTHPTIERWEQEDVTTAIETVPQGTIIRRNVEYRNYTSPPGRFRPRPAGESDILVRNNCIYYLDRYGSSALKDFRSDWLPDVCFPLRESMTWGDPNKGRDLWSVTGHGRKHDADPASVTPDTWRLEAGLASGDDNYVWFQKGTGLIAERTWHNGTYDDESVRLLRFEPAKQ